MGIELDEDNCIVSLVAPANTTAMQPGDYILSVDGHELGKTLLIDVLEAHKLMSNTEHVFRLRRPPHPLEDPATA